MEQLQLIKFRFELEQLPENGIYFFYEDGEIWEIDFTKRENRESSGDRRNIGKEKRIESAITKIPRETFSFRFIVIESQRERMRLESSLIGTVASCKLCNPSNNWLGNKSPKQQIKRSGLWLVQHLRANGINESDKETIFNAIRSTKEWIANGV